MQLTLETSCLPLRQYRESDWNEVCRVFDASKPYELARGGVSEPFVLLADDLQRISDFQRSTVYVWEENNKLRGFAAYDGSYISWLYVDPSAFRKDIARSLLRHVLAQVEGDPWLWAMKNNHPAVSLYRSEGFEIIEERDIPIGGLPCMAVKLARRKKTPDQATPPAPALRLR